jgi:hypothetical protein
LFKPQDLGYLGYTMGTLLKKEPKQNLCIIGAENSAPNLSRGLPALAQVALINKAPYIVV